jgi:hypothetical protein
MGTRRTLKYHAHNLDLLRSFLAIQLVDANLANPKKIEWVVVGDMAQGLLERPCNEELLVVTDYWHTIRRVTPDIRKSGIIGHGLGLELVMMDLTLDIFRDAGDLDQAETVWMLKR